MLMSGSDRTTALPRRSTAPRWSGILYGLIGFSVAAGGAWLAALGGSLYYLVAGTGILLCGALLIARRRSALWVYAAVLIGTLLWAVSEIGFDWWPLAARGDIIVPMGLWLLLPSITRNLDVGAPSGRMAMVLPLWLGMGASAVVLLIGLFSNYHEIDGTLSGAVSAMALQAEADQPDEDWRSYGRTQAGQRFSPLAQITPANASKLKVAWIFRTGDMKTDKDPGEETFQVTPLKVRDTLYLCSQHQRLFAVDARSGKLRWSFDPHVNVDPTFQHLTCRGVSYHDSAPPAAIASPSAPSVTGDCQRTIFLPVNDGRMIAINADNGKPCAAFGKGGTLNLQEGMGVQTAGFYEPTSPPIVSDKVIVIAGAVIDNYSTAEPSGVVRGYDVRTGKLLWAWDSGNLDENAAASATHTYTNNSPNSWAPAAYDAKLGLLYLPMGVGTPDIWGGYRTAAVERYSSAIVALDINSGKRVWHYQTVHHDLWDMDVPAQPTLVDLKAPGGIVPALLQPTKTGNIFVLDRRTGRLIVPAPERPVPQGAAPGDRVSPTQPFSQLTLRPEAKLTGADMWGATLFDQLACRIQFHQLRYEGTFTPPSEQGTLVFPGNLGIFEWGGIAVDPRRQIAIANTINMPFVSKLLPRGPDNPAAPNASHPSGSEVGVQPMYGTPFGVVIHPFVSPLGLPCMRPPWGYLAGIDLKTMKVAWTKRNGTIRDSSAIPFPFKMGVPSLGGPLVTAGGVAFLTSTADYYIRAYDVSTGRLLWQDRLPAGGQSTPMSYAIDRRQFVVTAAGGHGSFPTKRGDYVIAYSLGN
jgi:quinoprotein glucose dehydrogenase